MVANAGSNLLAIAPIKKAALETGYPLDQMWPIGALALICLVLYAIPSASVLGAIMRVVLATVRYRGMGGRCLRSNGEAR